MQICTDALGGARVLARAKLAMRDLGYFGCPVFRGLGSGDYGACQNYDGVVVVAADEVGKEEEDYVGGSLMSPEATSALLYIFVALPNLMAVSRALNAVFLSHIFGMPAIGIL